MLRTATAIAALSLALLSGCGPQTTTPPAPRDASVSDLESPPRSVVTNEPAEANPVFAVAKIENAALMKEAGIFTLVMALSELELASDTLRWSVDDKLETSHSLTPSSERDDTWRVAEGGFLPATTTLRKAGETLELHWKGMVITYVPAATAPVATELCQDAAFANLLHEPRCTTMTRAQMRAALGQT